MEWHWVDRETSDLGPNDVCRTNGYLGWSDTGTADVFAFVCPMIFNHRVVIGNAASIFDLFCYSDAVKAVAALKAWDGRSEPDGWIKHPPSGRFRPDADPARVHPVVTVIVDSEGVAWADVIAPTSGGLNMGTIHLVGANTSTPACAVFPFKAPTRPWQANADDIECRRCRRILTDRGIEL